MGHFASEWRYKKKINSVDEKKQEDTYYTDLSASELDSEFSNNATPKTEEKHFPKLITK